ncbi:MAG TPA: hypothetical protein DCY64_02475 [Hydrogenophaga sp.]|uniref:hypothetical protein n=1 Tax=Hydrogenophaga sp. TaxID=1904254 RepID=UPI0008C883E4|nr:hypothetical protein [Hydrogenophaga sp.]OGA78896.1 MAG: hypothetical protein A2X73_08160 [Burkholderiales bacterium GWE1_65_30]OGA91195.1 MAG: hypothetical protein A2X72_07595 [Burkholderiales bacterium GWF1_66_17]HAX19133.1 hypothetical protein [Hydrogenophaga sp.]
MSTNNPIAQVDALRTDIDRVREELQWVNDSPLPKDDWKASVTRWFEGMSAAGGNQTTALRDLRKPKPSSGGGFVKDTFLAANSTVHQKGAAPDVLPVNVRLAPMLCWLLGDQLEQRLHAMIDADEYVPGPTLADRPKLQKALLGELRELETREEAIITAAEGESVFIGRRADADPAVVLGYDPEGDFLLPETRGWSSGPRVVARDPALGSSGSFEGSI